MIFECYVALHQSKRTLAEGILEGGDGMALPSTDDLIALLRETRNPLNWRAFQQIWGFGLEPRVSPLRTSTGK